MKEEFDRTILVIGDFNLALLGSDRSIKQKLKGYK